MAPKKADKCQRAEIEQLHDEIWKPGLANKHLIVMSVILLGQEHHTEYNRVEL